MIYLRREINIIDGVAQFEKPVTLRKGDNDIDIELKINDFEALFRDNIVFYRYALVRDGLTLRVHENQAKNGVLCINLTDLDIGNYSIAIQLIDSEKDSKITIPLIENIIEVLDNPYDLDAPVEPGEPGEGGEEPGGGEEPEIKQYTVIFIDYDGTVLGEFVVNEGDTVTPPVPQEREGYNFIGWNKDFSIVNSNLFIIAQYEEQESEPEDRNFYLIKDGVMLEEFSIINENNANGIITQMDKSFMFSNSSTSAVNYYAYLKTLKTDYNWSMYKEIVVVVNSCDFRFEGDKTIKLLFDGYTYTVADVVIGDNIFSLNIEGLNKSATKFAISVPPKNSSIEIKDVYLVPNDKVDPEPDPEPEPVVFTPQTFILGNMAWSDKLIKYPEVYNLSSTNRCFSADLIYVKEGCKYKIVNESAFSVFVHEFDYDNKYTTIEYVWFTDEYEYIPPSNIKFFTLYFKKNDGTNITNTDGLINNVKVYEIKIDEPVDNNLYLIKEGVMLEEFTIVNDSGGKGFIEQNDGYFKFYNTSTASNNNMASLKTVKTDYNWANYKELVVELKSFRFPWSWDKTFKVRFNGYTKTYKENEYVIGNNIVSMVGVGIQLESTHVDLRIPPQNSYVEITNVYLVPFE